MNPFLFVPACYFGAAVLTANLGAFAVGCWWIREVVL
jgi:hypothetical protein